MPIIFGTLALILIGLSIWSYWIHCARKFPPGLPKHSIVFLNPIIKIRHKNYRRKWIQLYEVIDSKRAGKSWMLELQSLKDPNQKLHIDAAQVKLK